MSETRYDDSYKTYPPYCEGSELALAAASYAMREAGRHHDSSVVWPWGEESFKPHTHRENCVRAAALLLAEIERLDRATLSTGEAVSSAKAEKDG